MKTLLPDVRESILLESRDWVPSSLADTLARRRSVRDFAPLPLSKSEVLMLCWAASGITDDEGLRTTPSAGAMCPMTLLVVDADGVFEYLPEKASLQLRHRGDVRAKLQAAALDQPCVGHAPCCLVLVMDVESMALKYGPRAERYCFLEAGHAAQNVLLMATDLGLGGVPVGAFSDLAIASVLKLPPEMEPVYLLPVGHPSR